MSYQKERDQFIAQATREGLPLSSIRALLRCATTIHRIAELACSSEAADLDRIACPGKQIPGTKAGYCLCDAAPGEQHQTIPRIRLQDHRAEQRAQSAVPPGWRVITEGDPRGYTLRVIPPSYAERNRGRTRFNLDAIGVPAGPSGLRW